MKRLIALILSCSMLISALHLEVFAEGSREAEPDNTLGGTYETEGFSVDFQLAEEPEETTLPQETEPAEATAPAEETQPQTESSVPETVPPTEPLATESIEEDANESMVSQVPVADAILQSGDFCYTILEDGVSCAITGYVGTDTELVIPETLEELTVVAIGDRALAGLDQVTSVTLPSVVTSIGKLAFHQCGKLSQITLPSALTTLGEQAFNSCWSLTSVVIPQGVTELPKYAFSDCSSLSSVTLPEKLTAIGNYAFYGCPIAAMELPDTLTTLGDYAFSCTALTEITIPESITELPQGVFEGCGKLTNVNLPQSLTTLGPRAFWKCGALETIALPEKLETLGGYAFYECQKLTSITIPASCKTIGTEAFRGCSDLESVTLKEGLETIGSGSFYRCTGLTEFTIPDTVKNLGSTVFMGCSSLTAIHLSEAITGISQCLLEGCENLTALEIPAGVTFIGERAFQGCRKLTGLKLPESITAIGGRAFAGCSALTELELPEGLTGIPEYIFAESGLVSITIPKNVTNMGSAVFQSCTSLKEVRLPSGLTSLNSYTFLNCSALETVVLPTSLQSMGIQTFAGCSSLQTIDLPDTLTSIDNNTFSGCSALLEIEIPDSVTVIRDSAFSGCSSLQSVRLPDTLADIRGGVFDGCASLERIVLPKALTYVPGYLFLGCSNLQEVQLPEGLTTIQAYAFSECSRLATINLPTSLQKIEYGAFYGCSSLGNLFIPSTVTSIEDQAFAYADVVFRCDLQSFAAIYAIDNRIPMVEQDDPSNDANLHLNPDNSYFRANIDGISATGNLSFVAHYAFKDGVSVSDMEIEFHIPESMQLLVNTLTLDGKSATDIPDYTLDFEAGILTLPLSAASGTIRFQLKPVSYGKLAMYSLIHFSNGNRMVWEVLGAIYEDVTMLSISVPGTTATDSVMIKGVTLPEKTVTIYVDGKEAATAKANKAGDYSAKVALPDVRTGRQYQIEAAAALDGAASTASATTHYDASLPKLLDLTIQHHGHSDQALSLKDTEILTPVMLLNPNNELTLTATFESIEDIQSVFFVSDRNGDRKFMKAHWDASQGAYVATGRFDESNPSYIPGELSVQYTQKKAPTNFDQPIPDSVQPIWEKMPENWKNADLTLNEQSDGKLDITYALDDCDGNAVQFRMIAEETVIPENLTAKAAEKQGYIKVADDSGNQRYVLLLDTATEYGVDILDFETNQRSKTYVCDAVSSGAMAPYAARAKAHSTPRSVIEGTINNTKQGVGHLNNATDLRRRVEKTPMDATTRSNCNGAIAMNVMGAFAGLALTFMGAGACIMLGIALGFTGPMWLAAMGIATLLGWGAQKIFEAVEDGEDYVESQVVPHEKGNLDPDWILDPSGYLYDAKTEKRITGATVTAYWIPYDEENETFWEKKPGDAEYGTPWSSLEYSQLNPLLTNHEGRYAWDVPEGWWRVKAEHPDYETAWSDWVPVPPIQTEVNIAMTAKPDPNRGDMDGDTNVTAEDVVYLLWHTLFPEGYPLKKICRRCECGQQNYRC